MKVTQAMYYESYKEHYFMIKGAGGFIFFILFLLAAAGFTAYGFI